MRKALIVQIAAMLLCNSIVFAQKLPKDYESFSKEAKIDWLMQHMTLSEKVFHMNTSPFGKKSYRQDADTLYNLPGFVSCDGPRGAKTGFMGLVNMPSPLNVAASWNTNLSYETGKAMAAQLEHLNSNQLFAPGLNLIRHPQSGRNNEYYSEDPVLSGRMAAWNIRGIQENGMIATPKHYAVNNFEIGRFRVNVTVPERVLREVYLEAFRIAVEEGEPWSLMTSYNSINGHFASANKHLLDILYNEWGFKGYVVSDYNAEMENAASALLAGTNVEMPGWTWFTSANISQALANGTLSRETFDTRFRKILEIKLAENFRDPLKMSSKIDFEAQNALVEKIGTEGSVLLKNKGNVLPLSPEKSVALIGPFAHSDLMKGVQGSSSCRTERVITAYDALRKKIGSNVTFTQGCNASASADSKAIAKFECTAEYFDNLELDGTPVLVRRDNEISKLSFSGSGAAVEAKGLFDKAFQFNGQSHLRIGEVKELPAGQDFTWSFWAYLPDQFPDKDGGLLSGYLWRENEFIVTPRYFDIFLFRDRARIRINYEMPDQTWNHVIVTRRGEMVSVYLNGEKAGSGKLPYTLPACPVAIGGSLVNDKNANCIIDDVKLFERALTDEEIAAAASKKKITDGLIFHEPCEDVNLAKGQTESFDEIASPLNLSARWTGRFKPEKTGKYYFTVHSNGGVRMFVNGVMQYDQWEEAWVEGQVRRAWVDMVAGNSYEIKIEFANWYEHNRGKGGFIKFAWHMPDDEQHRMIEQAKEAALNADVTVVMVGVEQQPFQGESNDLDHFYLPAYQNELIKAVSKANPNTVVVLFTAGGVDMRSWIDDVPALFEMFNPGEDGGTALVKLLYGDENPSGKLPVSYAASPDDLETVVVQKQYEDNLTALGYKMYDASGKKPLFAFGHGLSYTTFEYKKLKIKKEKGNFTASVLVENTGKYAGAEVVQVYVTDVLSSVEQPVKELGGFVKVYLQPGEKRWIKTTIDRSALMFFDEKTGTWMLEPGVFEFHAAAASDDIRITKQLKIKK